MIPPQFDYFGLSFSEGLAPAKLDGKWGYIDPTGTLVIQAQYDMAHPFHGNLASVQIGKKYGYIDKTAKYIWESSQ